MSTGSALSEIANQNGREKKEQEHAGLLGSSSSDASSSTAITTSSEGPDTTVVPPNIQEHRKTLFYKSWLELLLYLFFAAATFLIYAQKALNVTSLVSQGFFIAFSFVIAAIESARIWYHIKDLRGKKEGELTDYLKIVASTLTCLLFLISGITNSVNFGAEPTGVINFINSFGFPLGFITISTILLIVHLQNYSKQKNPAYLFAGFIFVAISLMSLGLIPGAIYGLPSLWPGVGIAMVTLGVISAFQNRKYLPINAPVEASELQAPPAATTEEQESKMPLVDNKAAASDQQQVKIPPRTKTRAWLDFFSAITFAAVAFILYARIPLGITNEWCTGFLAAISGLQVLVEVWRIYFNAKDIKDIRRKKAAGEKHEPIWPIVLTKIIPSIILIGLSTWVVCSRAFELAGSSTIFWFISTEKAMDISINWVFPIGYSCVGPFLLIGAIREYWNKDPRKTEDLIKPFIFLTLSILSTGLVASAYFALPDLWVPVGLIVTAIAVASLYLDWDVIRGRPPQNTSFEIYVNEQERVRERAEVLGQKQSLLNASNSNALSDSATTSVSSIPQPTFAVLRDQPQTNSSSASATTSSDSSLRHRPNALPKNLNASASTAQSSTTPIASHTNSATSLGQHSQ